MYSWQICHVGQIGRFVKERIEMSQRLRKVAGYVISLVMVALVFCQSGFISEAATKKLSAPSSFDYLWSGDYLVIKWAPVTNAASYELKILGVTTTITDTYQAINKNDLTLKNGKYQISFKIKAKPKKNSSYTASAYTTVSDAIPAVNYKDISSLSSAVSLSEADLIKWLKYYKLTDYTESEEGDYTVITVKVKDDNNKNDWVETQISGAEAELDNLDDGDILGAGISALAALFGDESAWDDYSDYISEKYDEINKQGKDEYKKTDKNKYYKFYWGKDLEDFGADMLSISYLKRNNDSPDKLFSKWSYDKDAGYYKKDDCFRDYKFMEYGTSGSGVGTRYVILVSVYRPIAVLN